MLAGSASTVFIVCDYTEVLTSYAVRDLMGQETFLISKFECPGGIEVKFAMRQHINPKATSSYLENSCLPETKNQYTRDGALHIGSRKFFSLLHRQFPPSPPASDDPFIVEIQAGAKPSRSMSLILLVNALTQCMERSYVRQLQPIIGSNGEHPPEPPCFHGHFETLRTDCQKQNAIDSVTKDFHFVIVNLRANNVLEYERNERWRTREFGIKDRLKKANAENKKRWRELEEAGKSVHSRRPLIYNGEER
jgi:hypothetical protein